MVEYEVVDENEGYGSEEDKVGCNSGRKEISTAESNNTIE